MPPINKAALLRESRKLTKEEMMLWLRNTTGQQITADIFDKLMRKYLPEESYYQKEVMDGIRENRPGSFVWKNAAGPYSQGGIPDVSAVIDGHYFGFEVKRPYIGVPSKLQIKTVKDIRKAGGTAAFVCFWHEAKEIIEEYERSQQALRTGGRSSQ